MGLFVFNFLKEKTSQDMCTCVSEITEARHKHAFAALYLSYISNPQYRP